MASRAEITARLADLRKLRALGIRSTSYQGETVEYRSDAEIASAIADLERQLAGADRVAPRIFNVHGRKGY
ncbi:phage head-tail joining protein [Brucella pituitosa]|uniref:phage head-tail joining protein n=1 Tax=Brucella pituitosa TaxID=571256 RepID=UPI000D0001E7|nr:hypothetical protein CQ062_01820 [Ochrobactrum sp. MYb68]